MSNRTLIIALLVTLALALVTVLVIRANRSPIVGWVPIGERLAELDSGRVRLVRVATPTGPGQSEIAEMTRDAAGIWILSLTTRSAQGGTPADQRWPTTWRVDASRLVSAFRLINDTRAAATPDAKAALGTDPVRVEFVLDDGSSLALGLASRRLGGQGLVEVSTTDPTNAPSGTPSGDKPPEPTRLAVVSESFHAFFTSPGPRSWRDPTLLPDLATGTHTPSRVRLIGKESAVALSKVGSRWALQEPVPAPAEPEVIKRLLSTLEGLRAVRFVDDAPGTPPTQAGFDTPLAQIIVERDDPGAEGRSPGTIRREIVIGAAADAGGRELFATVDGGNSAVIVASESLSKLRTDAEPWIALAASGVTSADVGAIHYQPVTTPNATPAAPAPGAPVPTSPPALATLFSRDLDGWSETRPDGSKVKQSSDRADQIAALLAFVNATPARSVTLSEPPGYALAGTLTLRSGASDPLEELTVARAAQPGIVLKTGRVFRIYPQPPELLRVLLGVADATAEPVQPDISK